jgi:thioredoxin-like negative regulator of GroEL
METARSTPRAHPFYYGGPALDVSSAHIGLSRTTVIAQGVAAESDQKVVAASVGTTGQVEEVHSEEDLDNFLGRSSGLVVLEVVSTRCRACRFFGPKYRRLASDYDKVQFLKVAGEENESTQRMVKDRFNVRTLPTFYFFRDGNPVHKHEGGDAEQLCNILNLATE